jgi:hypothetical protein
VSFQNQVFQGQWANDDLVPLADHNEIVSGFYLHLIADSFWDYNLSLA